MSPPRFPGAVIWFSPPLHALLMPTKLGGGLGNRLWLVNRCDETERMLVAEYYQWVIGTDLPESLVGKG